MPHKPGCMGCCSLPRATRRLRAIRSCACQGLQWKSTKHPAPAAAGACRWAPAGPRLSPLRARCLAPTPAGTKPVGGTRAVGGTTSKKVTAIEVRASRRLGPDLPAWNCQLTPACVPRAPLFPPAASPADAWLAEGQACSRRRCQERSHSRPLSQPPRPRPPGVLQGQGVPCQAARRRQARAQGPGVSGCWWLGLPAAGLGRAGAGCAGVGLSRQARPQAVRGSRPVAAAAK